jgi:SAM-dependent methyltransferase
MVVQEIARVVKKDGLVCIIVPSQGFEHKFPLDCFRYLPDGGKALFEYAGLEVIECYRNNSLPWRDLIIIGKKV